MMAMALGMSRAGPMPWKARKVLKRMSCEPVQKPQARDQMANQAQPRRKMRLCP